MDHLQSRGAERPLLRVGKDQRMRPGARRDEISRPPKLGQGAGIGRSRVNVTEREVGQGPSVFLRRGSGHGGRARMSERDAPEAWGELMGEGRGDEGRKDQRGGEVDWAVGRAAGVSVASKLIARSGLCSRRKAAKLAKDGHVSLNGQVLIDLSTRVRQALRLLSLRLYHIPLDALLCLVCGVQECLCLVQCMQSQRARM